ncbi:MAG: response regulator, partial [Treponema sp.]|nr:response regulator [Treponema sp.]
RLQTELEAALTEAHEANYAKTNFLANMSHEMRTPLNAIVGLSELILSEEDLSQQAASGKIEDNLSKIHSSGMTLLGIVNDILDISKIESGKFELLPVKYSTPSLINDIVSLNIVRIGDKPIHFKLIVDENLPEQLLGDDLRVRQVFNNLLSNAFKYTNSGTVEWNVSFEPELPEKLPDVGDNVWLVSSIKDTGAGIKSEDLEKLFKDYIQVNARAHRNIESTGLGLSITKHLADMMDGTITVESEYGKGSIFSVRLRQQFVSDLTIGEDTARDLMSARFTDNKRVQSAKLKRIDLSYASVLVVDDMPVNLDVAKGMLKPYGLRVDCVKSGPEAINLIRTCADNAENPRYDAVFMDHMMPGMDGIEAVRIIREDIGTDYARNVPIIALTANAIIGNEDMFLEHGFQAFISKPIDTLRLDLILRQWVRNKDREGGQIMITGVDIAAGLRRFAGNEEEYMKILKSYTVNTRPLLDVINKYLEEENLSDYAVTVHGIKGSSFGIGAMRLGTHAERMERLAKSGNKEQVMAANSAFLKSVNNLLGSIDSALDQYAAKNKKPVKAAPDPELLQDLRKACDEYDVGRIDGIMAALESFEYRNGAELVAWLHGQVEDMNFKEISNGSWPV